MQALNNIRVLDLSKVLAGPLCGQYLGNLGAQVTKVEPIGVGDDTRAWQPQREGESATFLAVNHNKRGLAVDLKTPRGQAVVQRLAQQADVVLQGFGAGTAAKLAHTIEHIGNRHARAGNRRRRFGSESQVERGALGSGQITGNLTQRAGTRPRPAAGRRPAQPAGLGPPAARRPGRGNPAHAEDER